MTDDTKTRSAEFLNPEHRGLLVSLVQYHFSPFWDHGLCFLDAGGGGLAAWTRRPWWTHLSSSFCGWGVLAAWEISGPRAKVFWIGWRLSRSIWPFSFSSVAHSSGHCPPLSESAAKWQLLSCFFFFFFLSWNHQWLLGTDRAQSTHFHWVSEALRSWPPLHFSSFAFLYLSSKLPPRLLLLLTLMTWSPTPTTALETPPVSFLPPQVLQYSESSLFSVKVLINL